MKRKTHKPSSVAGPKTTTLRLDPELHDGLLLIQDAVKLPFDRLVNDAVELFVRTRSQAIERDLVSRLDRIKAYRQRDPGFKAAIQRIARAEVDVPGVDPAEGRAATQAGPATAAVRKIRAAGCRYARRAFWCA